MLVGKAMQRAALSAAPRSCCRCAAPPIQPRGPLGVDGELVVGLELPRHIVLLSVGNVLSRDVDCGCVGVEPIGKCIQK